MSSRPISCSKMEWNEPAHRLRPGEGDVRCRLDPERHRGRHSSVHGEPSRPAAKRRTIGPISSAWEARSTQCVPDIRLSAPNPPWPCCGVSPTTNRDAVRGSKRRGARLVRRDPRQTARRRIRAQRYQSAAEVSDLLGRCLTHLQQPLTVPLPHTLIRVAGHQPAAAGFLGPLGNGTRTSCILFAGRTVRFAFGSSTRSRGWSRRRTETEAIRQGERTNREEIEQQIHALHAQVGHAGKRISGTAACGIQEDPIGTEIRKLLDSARSLEQEVQSGSMGAPTLFGVQVS